jgi:hypothetical protein
MVMKKSITLIFAAGIFLLAGCCTTPHVTRWEYKVTIPPPLPGDTNPPNLSKMQLLMETDRKWRENQQTFLNDLGKDGWVLINEDEGTFYFKRPVKDQAGFPPP